MKELTEEEKSQEEELRRNFLELAATPNGRNDAADVMITWRRRALAYRNMSLENEGELIANMARELELNEIQTARLQMMVRQANKRLKAAIKKQDPESRALHPLDR